jgi:hypothetical protein
MENGIGSDLFYDSPLDCVLLTHGSIGRGYSQAVVGSSTKPADSNFIAALEDFPHGYTTAFPIRRHQVAKDRSQRSQSLPPCNLDSVLFFPSY